MRGPWRGGWFLLIDVHVADDIVGGWILCQIVGCGSVSPVRLAHCNQFLANHLHASVSRHLRERRCFTASSQYCTSRVVCCIDIASLRWHCLLMMMLLYHTVLRGSQCLQTPAMPVLELNSIVISCARWSHPSILFGQVKLVLSCTLSCCSWWPHYRGYLVRGVGSACILVCVYGFNHFLNASKSELSLLNQRETEPIRKVLNGILKWNKTRDPCILLNRISWRGGLTFWFICLTLYGSWDMFLKLLAACWLTGVRSAGGPNELESCYAPSANMDTLITRGGPLSCWWLLCYYCVCCAPPLA